MLVELIQWTNYQKKITTNLEPNNNKATTCYLGPVIDVMKRKWFPLSITTSPSITTQDEHVG